MPEAMIVTNGMLASSGRFARWTTASATSFAGIRGSTIVVPLACIAPVAIRADISVVAFPMSIWPQAMLNARPSSTSDLVNPVSTVFGGGVRGRVRSGRISRDGAIVDDPATLRGLRLHHAERSAGAKKRAQQVGRDDRPKLCRAELIERYRGHVDSGIVEQECEATVPFDHGIKELLDRSVVGHIGDTSLNQSRALSELPGPLKRLHFSTGNDHG